MKDYHDYVGERVEIIDKDGEAFIGPVISYEVGLDVELDYDSLGVQVGEGYYIGVPIPDIQTIKILE